MGGSLFGWVATPNLAVVSKQYNLFLTTLQVFVVGSRMPYVKKSAMGAFVDLKGIVSFLANGRFSNRKCRKRVLSGTLYGSVILIGCFHWEPPLSRL